MAQCLEPSADEDVSGEVLSTTKNGHGTAGLDPHPAGRPNLEACAVGAAISGKVSGSLSRSAIVNPLPPRAMPHGSSVEGLKGFQMMAGEGSLRAGCASTNKENIDSFLDNSACQVVDGLPQRTSTLGDVDPSPRMDGGCSKEATTGSVPPQVQSKAGFPTSLSEVALVLLGQTERPNEAAMKAAAAVVGLPASSIPSD